MDFLRIRNRPVKGEKGKSEIYPDYRVMRSKDLMIRARGFYAVWDEEVGLWSTDEYDVQRLVDELIFEQQRVLESEKPDQEWVPRALGSFNSRSWLQFRQYVNVLSDSYHPLDEQLTFSNSEVAKTDYVSRRLPYPLEQGSTAAWDELVGTLYAPDEMAKLEWAIGAIVSGDSKLIQKFLVLYGKGGTGKSTVLNIIQKLFEGYYITFEAKALTSSNNTFAMEAFGGNPLVAIQHDGDLSKIEDNTKLNSIVSHEDMTVNEKFKPGYTTRLNAFLFMGTNKAVKITDAKSGIIRRLIDVHPTGNKIPYPHYQALLAQTNFELGAIAEKCLSVYQQMGREYYETYRPLDMMQQTDIFYNFIEAHWETFKAQDGTTLKQAYSLYKTYCDDALIEYKLPLHKFRGELANYFDNYDDKALVGDVQTRSWYSGFHADHFKTAVREEEPQAMSLVMDAETSLLDDILANEPAQYATKEGTPSKKWAHVRTFLTDLDTSKTHYVKVPPNHIVIDFDLKDADGDKSLERNLAAASQWPATYAETSQGGSGVHLHYIYSGDADELAAEYEPGVEVKVYRGDASLRRRVSLCNDVAVATISSGLPIKEKRVITTGTMQSERSMRELILRNLRKEIHPGTKPSIDFIKKILDDAYDQGMQFDISDLRGRITAFANNSTNQNLACLKVVSQMRFQGNQEGDVPAAVPAEVSDDRIVFFDVEVFPNLFVIGWKYQGDSNVVKMINPSPAEVEQFMSMKLVGFNNRQYDNHILYGRMMGYNNTQLYSLSQKLIDNDLKQGATFGAAYEVSYTDIYDFSNLKQSLKKFQLELGLKHKENSLDWSQPVPEELWGEVADYCANDVITTEQVFEARRGDWTARQILSSLSGLNVNATTKQHTSKIVFGNERRPQSQFNYTDLSERFPGYKYEYGKSSYKDETEIGEGGYVYAEPGIYHNVALLDVASMHPTSIEELDLFGPYTKNYSALKSARLAIKRGDYDEARKMLGGKLAPHLTNEEDGEALAYALKIVVNIVYGLTMTKFENVFRDPRNIDNIVAKRGALFMIDLKEMVQQAGFTVAHIKTDSIKIPDATPEIIERVMEFGNDYGYTFEHEATYEKMALVNDAVYVAKTIQGRKPPRWSATGAQFQHPYVFKTLFTGEPVTFDDQAELKTVTTSMSLEFGEGDDITRRFVGKAGVFVPVLQGGGRLVREKDGKFYSVGGTKGCKWLEAEQVRDSTAKYPIDNSYHESLVAEAVATINKFGNADEFLEKF